MKKKLIYLSGTRADFGLIKKTLISIDRDENLDLGIVLTGMHLLSAYGNTQDEVINSNLPIIGKIKVDLDGKSREKMANALAEQIKGMIQIINQWQPDFLIILGDRGEMLAAAIAGNHMSIPIIHIHGGERSGTIDDVFRHSISKLSNIHFVATEASKERLQKMGENKKNIYVVGAPGLDQIEDSRSKLLNKVDFCNRFKLKNYLPIIIILFHPVHQEYKFSRFYSQEIFNGLVNFVKKGFEFQALFIAPNSDAGSNQIIEFWNEKFKNPFFEIVSTKNMERLEYLSALSNAELLIGNSSSGIIEAESFNLSVINLGTRQRFRERNKNVIDIDINSSELTNALIKNFQKKKQKVSNIYGDGNTYSKIISIIKSLKIDPELIYKSFTY